MEPLRVEVDESDDGARLDALVARRGGVSRSTAAELVASGHVTVDGAPRPKAYRLSVGEVVEARPAPPAEDAEPPAMPPVVWEDEHLLVVSKPAGIVVHRAPGRSGGTLADALVASGRPLSLRGGEDRPGIVHRLDREVSGLLLVAKTDEAHQGLSRMLKRRRVRREYLAAVAGEPGVDRGKIDAPIGRHRRHRTRMAVTAEGRPSVTWFRVLERFEGGPAALLEVRLETGRTHQIRTHLGSIGHPILGDRTYGRDLRLAERIGLRRPFLHAFRLVFEHPVTGEEIRLESEPPDDLARALERLRAL